jgi:hypothetical protein
LLLLRAFFGSDSSELVSNIGILLRRALALVSHLDEITHSSGLLGGANLGFFKQ